MQGERRRRAEPGREHGVDHEYTSASALDAFIKYDFGVEYQGRITGQSAGVLEMKLSEAVKYSRVRWVVQPVPRAADGSGGASIPQDAGLQEGSRQVRGSVSATTLAAAQTWAKAQRSLLTGDNNNGHYPVPEEMDTDYEFVPRVDGVAQGNNQNVRLFRVNFTFGEILPLYAAPSQVFLSLRRPWTIRRRRRR